MRGEAPDPRSNVRGLLKIAVTVGSNGFVVGAEEQRFREDGGKLAARLRSESGADWEVRLRGV
jgi:hypothetical protein